MWLISHVHEPSFLSEKLPLQWYLRELSDGLVPSTVAFCWWNSVAAPQIHTAIRLSQTIPIFYSALTGAELQWRSKWQRSYFTHVYYLLNLYATLLKLEKQPISYWQPLTTHLKNTYLYMASIVVIFVLFDPPPPLLPSPSLHRPMVMALKALRLNPWCLQSDLYIWNSEDLLPNTIDCDELSAVWQLLIYWSFGFAIWEIWIILPMYWEGSRLAELICKADLDGLMVWSDLIKNSFLCTWLRCYWIILVFRDFNCYSPTRLYCEVDL